MSFDSSLYEETVIRVLRTGRGFIIETTPGWFFLVCISAGPSEWNILYGLDGDCKDSAVTIFGRARILGRIKTGVDPGPYPRLRFGPPEPVTESRWRKFFRSVVRFFSRPG